MARSHRLAGPVVLGDAPAPIYTAPGGDTVLVKSVRITNVSGADVTLFGSLTGSLDNGAVYASTPVLADRPLIDDTWWVMPAGEVLSLWASVADALVVIVSGAILAD